MTNPFAQANPKQYLDYLATVSSGVEEVGTRGGRRRRDDALPGEPRLRQDARPGTAGDARPARPRRRRVRAAARSARRPDGRRAPGRRVDRRRRSAAPDDDGHVGRWASPSTMKMEMYDYGVRRRRRGAARRRGGATWARCSTTSADRSATRKSRPNLDRRGPGATVDRLGCPAPLLPGRSRARGARTRKRPSGSSTRSRRSKPTATRRCASRCSGTRPTSV